MRNTKNGRVFKSHVASNLVGIRTLYAEEIGNNVINMSS